jgi:hypothetical protein
VERRRRTWPVPHRRWRQNLGAQFSCFR